MKSKAFFTGSLLMTLMGAVFLQGCRTYQPGVSSSRRTIFSTPKTTETAQPIPAKVTTASQPSGSASSIRPVSVQPRPVTPTATSATVRPVSATPVTRTMPSPRPVTPTVTSAVPAQPSREMNYRMYTVKSGDVAGRIANENGMTLKEFVELNNITNPNSLRVGQTVKIAAGRKPLSGRTPAVIPEERRGSRLLPMPVTHSGMTGMAPLPPSGRAFPAPAPSLP